MMPDTLTDNQIKGLENFKNNILDYYAISIWKDFYIDEYSSLNCVNMTNENYELSVMELLDIFIKQKKNTK